MKPLIKNYSLDLDKDEKKIVITLLKQTLKQIRGNEKYFQYEKAFSSILSKLENESESVKLIKDEYFKLKNQMSESLNHYMKELPKSWFIKKWLYKSLIKQYTSIIQKHFKV